MSFCASSNCGYYYQAIGEAYPRCHCPDDGFPAPCEYDDDDCQGSRLFELAAYDWGGQNSA